MAVINKYISRIVKLVNNDYFYKYVKFPFNSETIFLVLHSEDDELDYVF